MWRAERLRKQRWIRVFYGLWWSEVWLFGFLKVGGCKTGQHFSNISKEETFLLRSLTPQRMVWWSILLIGTCKIHFDSTLVCNQLWIWQTGFPKAQLLLQIWKYHQRMITSYCVVAKLALDRYECIRSALKTIQVWIQQTGLMKAQPYSLVWNFNLSKDAYVRLHCSKICIYRQECVKSALTPN